MTADRRQEAPPRWAMTLVRSARTGSLATLARNSGLPYVSLVTTATDPAGAPVLLVSRLALHTQNLEADPRVSLLFDASALSGGARGEDDPLALGRVTVMGRLAPAEPARVRGRFLARHPNAAMYVDFPDFSFYRLDIDAAHFIGGFGRIVDLAGRDLIMSPDLALSLADAEPDIIAHMNADHADALQLYATALLGERPSDWRMAAIDPEGLDLVSTAGCARLWFAEPLTSAAAVRQTLSGLAAKARAKSNGKPD